jgi:hypothetical protein
VRDQGAGDAVLDRHARLSAEQRSAIEQVTATGQRRRGGRPRRRRQDHDDAGRARSAWEARGLSRRRRHAGGQGGRGPGEGSRASHRGTLASWELALEGGQGAARSSTAARSSFWMRRVWSRRGRWRPSSRAVSRAGAKLVLVGDPDQLQPIEAGAAFRAHRRAHRLCRARNDLPPKRAQWMRDASLDLARGRIGESARQPIAASRARHGCPNSRRRRSTALIDGLEPRLRSQRSRRLILAHLRRDVRALNDLARAKLDGTRGLVGGRGTPSAPRRASAGLRSGDQIVFPAQRDLARRQERHDRPRGRGGGGPVHSRDRGGQS